MIFQLSNKALKDYFQSAFNHANAAESKAAFGEYLRSLIQEAANGLKVDIEMLDKDLSDDYLCDTRKFGAIDSLKRVLLPIAEAAAYKATIHPDWSLLGGRLETIRIKLIVPETFSELLDRNPTIWRNDSEANSGIPLDYYAFAKAHSAELDSFVAPERDYDLYFFGVRTLEKSYLMRLTTGGDQLLETPQYMYLRIAAALFMPDLQMIKKYYDLMSLGYFTHASPTMFHAGIAKGSLASCFLLSMQDDLEKIFKCLGQCAMISKSAGGIGLDVSNIRHSKVSHMGNSSGIVPMLQVYNSAMRYVDQCFAADTIVYTAAGIKYIADVTADDYVMTATGEFERVAKPMHYTTTAESGDVFSLTLEHYFGKVCVSGVHPMLCVKGAPNILSELDSGARVLDYTSVSNLEPGDYLATPVSTYIRDCGSYSLDDCSIYGLLVDSGSCVNNTFTLTRQSDSEIFGSVEKYLRARNIPYTRQSGTFETISWNGHANFPFTMRMFTEKNMRIIHGSMIHLPLDKTLAIVKGMLYDYLAEVSFLGNKTILYYNPHQLVMESLRFMLLRLRIPTTGTEGYLCIPKLKPLFDTDIADPPLYYRDMLLSKIIEMNIATVPALLVELEMENQLNANYVTSIGVAHNGGRRKGSATIFLQPWHIDFPDFILMKRQHGKEERRARDLFYSVWNCDIFMRRVREDSQWTLFCPKFAPMLKNTYGDEFDKWYLHYEAEAAKASEETRMTFSKVMSARELWNELLTTQIETGMPFMTNKDTANATSNQQNLGLIRSSNLCVEIVEVTDDSVISSCNLASIALDEFVAPNGSYNFEALGETTRLIIRGLNRVIDRTYYPLMTATDDGPIKSTNMKYRPLGLGVQALADTFLKMKLAWTDPAARELNKEIFATIYYNAVYESVQIAKVDGVYTGFYGSPASKGLLKPDLLAAERARKAVPRNTLNYAEALAAKTAEYLETSLSTRYDWQALRALVKEYGMRNSLLVALMPTASSAQIRYKNESFEPFTTNMYVRSVLAGNHLIVNRYMVAELTELGLWNKSIVNFIIKNEGSIATLPLEIAPVDKRDALARIKEKCKTAFELPQKLLVDMSIDRACYVCQSQSLNIHIKDPSFKQMTSLHFYAWENGLTTGMYYLRTAPATEAIKFTVEGELDVKKAMVCTDEVCVMCTS